MYFEKQALLRCGVHSVNNLIGAPAFEAKDFEEIANLLSPESSAFWHPHKAPLGMGNYDVNVLEYALLKHQLTLSWHDNRLPFAQETLDDDDNSSGGKCVGLMLNELSPSWAARLWGARHWIAVRRVGNYFWNLDSVQKEPSRFETRGALDAFVSSILERNGYCLLVRKQQ